ncbi:hypothetical protein BH11GEM1_BH11GEM1_33290 [soil metagenome]
MRSVEVGLLAARVLLGCAFALAGATKFVDVAGSTKAIHDFGAPGWLSGPLARVLPLAELAIAVLLFAEPTARWGAAGAGLLLLLFTVAISVNLARGRAPHCRCFGQLRSSPIGWPSLVRNGALGVMAVLVLSAGPGTDWAGAIRALDASGAQPAVLLGGAAFTVLALGLQTWLLVQAVRQNGRLLLRMDDLEARVGGVPPLSQSPYGLPIGAPAPAFALRSLSGASVDLKGLSNAGKPALVIFTNPNCGPCSAMLPDIGRWQRRHRDEFRILLVSQGSEQSTRDMVAGHDIEDVLLQVAGEVADAYLASGTPAAVLVDADGRIASRLAMGATSIAELISSSTVESEDRKPDWAATPQWLHDTGTDNTGIVTSWT